MKIERYVPDHKVSWDEFVSTSKNGTFLFFRDYMDYYRERFVDHSLLVHDDDNRLVALLPAHRELDTLVSHGGLTYGGFISNTSMKLSLMLRVFETSLTYLKDSGVQRVIYKTIPHIYHRSPAEEDRYALFVAGATWIRSGMLAVVQRDRRVAYQERRHRGIKRARGQGLTVAQSTDFEGYWVILTQLLEQTYLARPVHTSAEMRLLSQRFPEHVKLFACYQNDTMVAGVVVYESATVARAQYIASTDSGRARGAVDLLLDHLLTEIYPTKDYFDFGTSEADTEHTLNRGLIDQKEGFGARAVGLDHYGLDLTDWRPGQMLRTLT